MNRFERNPDLKKNERLGRCYRYSVIVIFTALFSLNFVKSEPTADRAPSESPRLPAPWQQRIDTQWLELSLEQAKPTDRSSPSYALAVGRLAHARLQAGRYEEAETLAKEALRIRQAAFSEEHPAIGDSFHQLALIHYVRGWYVVARDLFNEAIRIREANFGPDHPLVAESLAESALIYIAFGELSMASGRLFRALEIAKAAGDVDPLLIPSILGRLSVLRLIQKRHEEAVDFALESLRFHNSVAGHRWPGVATALESLRRIDESTALPAVAHRVLRRLVEVVERRNSVPNRYTASTFNTLGLSYWAAGDLAEAEKSFVRTVEIIRESDTDHPLESRALMNLGRLLASQNRIDEAREALVEAQAISRRVLRPEHNLNRSIERSLASLSSPSRADRS